MHLAIIPDGNRRWADSKNVAHHQGHQAGMKALMQLFESFKQFDEIHEITLFGFSTENAGRSLIEVAAISSLLKHYSKHIAERCVELNFRLSVLGDFQSMPTKDCTVCEQMMQQTQACDGKVINFCYYFSGHWHLEQALLKAKKSEQSLKDVMNEWLKPVDLLIRTGKEHRISNFCLYQLAYAELYFSEVYWPDFGVDALKKALDWFATRKRRYGGDG